MPDHLHLVVPGAGAGERLRRVLSACTALFGVRFDVLAPEPANSRDIAARTVRYGLLNPVRAGLVDDPWAWPWSTLRDLGGAAYPVWTAPARIAAVLAIPPKTLFSKLATTADHRAPPPRRVPIAIASLDALRCAVGSTLRVPAGEVLAEQLGRRLVVQASEAFAMPSTSRLAKELGCCERTIQRDRAPRHSALDAVLLCLGDERLRRCPGAVADLRRG